MKRLLKWAGYGLAGLVGLVVLALGGAFAASEAMIRWPVEKPEVALVASRDAGAVARGRKVATLNGCHQCHGDAFQGMLFHDEPGVLKAWGANLSVLNGKASDADLDRAIRHGVGADGRRLWVMPSSAFRHLTDRETADLIAYMRTFRPQGEAQPRFEFAPIVRVGLLLGKFRSEAATIAADAALKPAEVGSRYARGRDLSRACIECHGPELKGGGFLNAPDLSVAASYEPAEFETLLRTGVASGGRKLGLMSGVSPGRFNVWTTDEISDLHAYLKARAERQFETASAGNLSKP